MYYLFKDENDFLRYKFLPTIQCDTVSNSFLPTHPENLVETAPPLSVITGINSMEGLIGLGGNVFYLFIRLSYKTLS